MENKITKEHIDSILEKAEWRATTAFDKTTIVTAKLPNGFTITDSSSCVDPANYDQEVGKKLAVNKIIDKLWELEGYRLQCEMNSLKCIPQWTITREEIIAKTCHEANREYCRMIGDDSQLAWEDAPDWQKQSCIDGVKFHLENPDVGPEGSHVNWLKHKEADGWKYGPVKDPDKKEHPCFVPYDQLPIEQRIKDMIFTSIVKAKALS